MITSMRGVAEKGALWLYLADEEIGGIEVAAVELGRLSRRVFDLDAHFLAFGRFIHRFVVDLQTRHLTQENVLRGKKDGWNNTIR
jgi:hypothetical protein